MRQKRLRKKINSVKNKRTFLCTLSQCFDQILNMTIKEYPEEKLNKYFDEENRIVRIDFLASGNTCSILYNEDNQKTMVIWSNGFTYRFNTDGSFTEIRA